MYDVLIIGAGVVGTAIARRLSRYQLKIAILEAENDVAMGSSKANSAIVHGGYAEANAKLKGRVCYQGRRQYAQLDKELNFGFRETGSLVITMDEADLPRLEAIKENGEKNGLPDLEILEHDEILAIEPNVNPDVKYALYCKGAGVCSPYEMTVALAENAIHNGAELFLNSAYSDKVDQMVNEPTFTITPRSGEYILLGRGTGHVLNTVVFAMPTKMGKGILVTSTFHDNLLLGPDAIDEDAATATKKTNVDRLYKIYKQGLASYAHVDPSKFIRSFCGLRAVSSTDDFVIGPSATKGFLNVAGIQSPGLTSAPGIADLVTEMLEEEGLKLVPDESYDPYRKAIIRRKTEMKPADYVHRHLWREAPDSRRHGLLPGRLLPQPCAEDDRPHLWHRHRPAERSAGERIRPRHPPGVHRLPQGTGRRRLRLCSVLQRSRRRHEGRRRTRPGRPRSPHEQSVSTGHLPKRRDRKERIRFSRMCLSPIQNNKRPLKRSLRRSFFI